MNEYYSVTRTKDYLSHAAGSPDVYKNHKYIARAKTKTGKYRYFYNVGELTAYKDAAGANPQPAQPTQTPTRRKLPASFGSSHLSSGALNYQGESTKVNPEGNGTLINEYGPKKKKKKNKSKKTSVVKVIQSMIRR